MAELKTKQTDQSVEAFLNSIADENRRRDCYTVVEIIEAGNEIEAEDVGSQHRRFRLATLQIRERA